MTALELIVRGLAYAGLVAEGLCVVSFLVTGMARHLPAVFGFLAYLFLSDAFLVAVVPASESWRALVITTYISYLFEAAAITELAVRVALTARLKTASKRVRVTALWCTFLMLATFLMANPRSYGDFGVEEGHFLRVDLTAAIFRALAFVALLVSRRRDKWVHYTLAVRITLLFAVYAIGDLLMHIFNELGPWLRLPGSAFEISECVCGYAWIILLVVITWQVMTHTAPARACLSDSAAGTA